MSKRFTALLMALVLVVGVFAVPAMAATGDTVSPQACSHPVKIYTGYYETDWLTINSYTCVHGYSSNRDEVQRGKAYQNIYCGNCGDYLGNRFVGTEQRIFCLAQNRVCTHDHDIM